LRKELELRDFKQWSAAERRASAWKTKKAIEDGTIPPPEDLGCNRCGQKQGILQYHNHDYSDPVKYLEPLCWRCHMILHSTHINSQACQEYWDNIWLCRFQEQSAPFKPVYKLDFIILRRDHSIIKL